MEKEGKKMSYNLKNQSEKYKNQQNCTFYSQNEYAEEIEVKFNSINVKGA